MRTSDRQAWSSDRHTQMTGDSMWDAFAEAIVRIDLKTGPAVLAPEAFGIPGVCQTTLSELNSFPEKKLILYRNLFILNNG